MNLLCITLPIDTCLHKSKGRQISSSCLYGLQVEIEVPGPCHYIVRTTECTLSEVTEFDEAGHPVFAPAATADAFKAAMEK